MNPDGGERTVEEGRAYELQQAVEALVFAAEEPVEAGQIASVFEAVTGEAAPSSEQVQEVVEDLNERLAGEGHALRIQSWAGGYRMTTTREVAPYVKAYFSHQRRRRLSRSLMETVAILAYRQPATKPEIDFVRGVDSDYALKKLLDLGLADVLGRSEAVGRPLLYGTTHRFLEAFGLDRLEDLPNLREIEAMLDDPAFNAERARLLMMNGLNAPDDVP